MTMNMKMRLRMKMRRMRMTCCVLHRSPSKVIVDVRCCIGSFLVTVMVMDEA